MNRYHFAFFLLAFLLFSACAGDQSKFQKEIRKLEKQLEENADLVVAKNLLRQYMLYYASYPDDRERNSRYLYRAAGAQLRLDQPEAAANTLLEALKQYSDTKNTYNNAALLAAVYEERLRDTASARTIRQVLARAYPDQAEKIEPGATPLETRLEYMRRQVFADETGRINHRMANYFIHSVELATMIQPQAPGQPEWLAKAAEIARATKKNAKALELYEWIYDQYPSFEKAPQALFLRAFILDEELNRKEEAEEAYRLFLERYPDDEFADDAQFLLDNLNKNEEEIINEFEEQSAAEAQQ